MSTFRLILAELSHRWVNFGLSLVAVSAATVLFVMGPTLLAGYAGDTRLLLAEQEQAATKELADIKAETANRLVAMERDAETKIAAMEKETIQVMRDLGFNLRIYHRSTDAARLLAGFESFDMPEEYVARLANSPEVTKIAHLVATLRQMIDVGGQPRLLVGYAPEATQVHVEKKERVMGYQIRPGTVILGHHAGSGRKIGESLELLGGKFEIVQILDEHGTREEDIAIMVHLRDAQQLLEKPGKISEIVALGCKCKTVQRVEEIREQLEAVLPEAQVVEVKLAADARDRQRKLVSQYHRAAIDDYSQSRLALVARQTERQAEVRAELANSRAAIETLLERLVTAIVPLVVLACAVWVGLLAWTNIRERHTEIGLLRALGRDESSVALLVLGRALLVGLGGGIVGCAIGFFAGRWLALDLLAMRPESLSTDWLVLALAVGGAPLVSALAAYLPALWAIRQDPAAVLFEG